MASQRAASCLRTSSCIHLRGGCAAAARRRTSALPPTPGPPPPPPRPGDRGVIRRTPPAARELHQMRRRDRPAGIADRMHLEAHAHKRPHPPPARSHPAAPRSATPPRPGAGPPATPAAPTRSLRRRRPIARESSMSSIAASGLPRSSPSARSSATRARPGSDRVHRQPRDRDVNHRLQLGRPCHSDVSVCCNHCCRVSTVCA